MTCRCNRCPACRERLLGDYERDLAECKRMRKARKSEPLEHATPACCLGPGRPLRHIYTRAMGAGPGGES